VIFATAIGDIDASTIAAPAMRISVFLAITKFSTPASRTSI
jgi:hypothetical protein